MPSDSATSCMARTMAWTWARSSGASDRSMGISGESDVLFALEFAQALDEGALGHFAVAALQHAAARGLEHGQHLHVLEHAGVACGNVVGHRLGEYLGRHRAA